MKQLCGALLNEALHVIERSTQVSQNALLERFGEGFGVFPSIECMSDEVLARAH
jgi:hypothetical protein